MSPPTTHLAQEPDAELAPIPESATDIAARSQRLPMDKAARQSEKPIWGADPPTGEGDSIETANDKLLNELRAINKELQVPSPEQFGITRERFFELRETMARQALASGSPGNNPRVPTEAEIIDLYETVWNQE